MSRIGLVGCVKTKREVPSPARELYTSALFIGRRAAVESTCDRWLILSAKHGVIEPDVTTEPYDETLIGKPVGEKRAWSRRVLDQLAQELGHDLQGVTFEIHAGADYCGFGLLDGLRERGAGIELPTAGLGLGQQLRFYKDRGWLRG